MSTRRWIPPHVVGECRLHSRPFSNRWILEREGKTIVELRRDPSRHTADGTFAYGTQIELTPGGWGTVALTADGSPLSRIDRRSWWGRRWEISGAGFACDLTSDRRPRRWTLRIGGHPIGHLAGTAWSYNRLDVHTEVSIPVHALVLSWHVLTRPWEQAATPRLLVPDRSDPA